MTVTYSGYVKQACGCPDIPALGVQAERGVLKQDMISIKAITFDLDDTLWEIEPVIAEAEQHTYQWLSANCPRVTEKYSLLDIQDIRQNAAAEYPEHAHDLSMLRRLSFSKIFALTEYGEFWVEKAFQEFMRMRNQVRLFPDAARALGMLAKLFPIASVTNGNADLDQIGIRHHFKATITATEYGVAKPHRDLFWAACNALHSKPGEVLHIGDHPEHDVLGAAAAGLRTIWLNRRGHTWQHAQKADAEVKDLDEVLQILNV